MKRLFLIGILLLVAAPAQAARYYQPAGDPELAVQAIITEAENQGLEGMIAAGEAIRNGARVQIKARRLAKAPAWVWRQAREAWRLSKGTNTVKGAAFFENIKAFGEPGWAKGKRVTAIVRDHVFYV